MASIRKRGGHWEARIRRRGHPLQSKSFPTKAQAEAWSRQIEGEIDRGIFISRSEAERTTLHEAFERYEKEILPLKRRSYVEARRINQWKKRPLAQRFLAAIRTSDIAKHRDERLKEVSSNTVRLELATLSHLYTVAASEWGMDGLINPVKAVRKPSLIGTARERRLSTDLTTWQSPTGKKIRGTEETRLLAYCTQGPEWLAPMVTFAIETGMRRSEIVGLTWGNVDTKKRIAKLLLTKNGESRTVPLSSKAIQVLKSIHKTGPRVFPVSADHVSQEFAAACKRAKIKNLRFHDLRHEATSRLFELGLDLMEVASITGHKTLSMLKRYTHLRAEQLAIKLG